jgi:hypothetical protein
MVSSCNPIAFTHYSNLSNSTSKIKVALGGIVDKVKVKTSIWKYGFMSIIKGFYGVNDPSFSPFV